MKELDISPLQGKPYFTSAAVGQLYNLNSSSSNQQLSRWVTRGVVIRLKQGYYTTRDFQIRHSNEPGFIEALSSAIDQHSYVSREYVLQQHGVLTDVSYAVTAVTEKNTRQIVNEVGTFEYRHLKSGLFTGYQTYNFYGMPYNVADKSKALFDYLYFRPLRSFPTQRNIAEELRLNLEDWSYEDKGDFSFHVTLSDSPKMKKLFNNIQRHVW